MRGARFGFGNAGRKVQAAPGHGQPFNLDRAMKAAAPEATTMRLLVCITFHYAPNRLRYLFATLASLCTFPVHTLDVIVCTNTVSASELEAINRTATGLFSDGRRVEVVSFPNLPHPYELAWTHKPILEKRFLGKPYDMFIYLEDDLRLTFDNLLYLLAARHFLAALKLIPGFMRYEYHRLFDGVFVSDQLEQQVIEGRGLVTAADTLFSNLGSPYQGLYLLDQALAQEFIATPSFDMIASSRVIAWAIRERAAMGLAFESPPPGFVSRFAAPLDLSTWIPKRCCWVHHMANNYAENRDPDDPNSVLGSILVDRLFR